MSTTVRQSAHGTPDAVGSRQSRTRQPAAANLHTELAAIPYLASATDDTPRAGITGRLAVIAPQTPTPVGPDTVQRPPATLHTVIPAHPQCPIATHAELLWRARRLADGLRTPPPVPEILLTTPGRSSWPADAAWDLPSRRSGWRKEAAEWKSVRLRGEMLIEYAQMIKAKLGGIDGRWRREGYNVGKLSRNYARNKVVWLMLVTALGRVRAKVAAKEAVFQRGRREGLEISGGNVKTTKVTGDEAINQLLS